MRGCFDLHAGVERWVTEESDWLSQEVQQYEFLTEILPYILLISFTAMIGPSVVTDL
jgi:phosphate starvation-inducible membrane PsiE